MSATIYLVTVQLETPKRGNPVNYTEVVRDDRGVR